MTDPIIQGTGRRRHSHISLGSSINDEELRIDSEGEQGYIVGSEPKVKMQKVTTNGTRPCRKDYDADSRPIIDYACKVYKCLLASECAFPDASIEAQFVRAAWDVACKDMGQDLEMTSEIDGMVRLSSVIAHPNLILHIWVKAQAACHS